MSLDSKVDRLLRRSMVGCRSVWPVHQHAYADAQILKDPVQASRCQRRMVVVVASGDVVVERESKREWRISVMISRIEIRRFTWCLGPVILKQLDARSFDSFPVSAQTC